MASKILISIITPTYNHEDYILKCIQSVCCQSYIHWEMIIIDDCSSDSTFQLIQKQYKKNKKITIIRHKKRWGINKLKATYNQALKRCTGEFVAILEGDDYWPKDKLKHQIRELHKNPKAVLSYGKWTFVNSNGFPIYTRDYPYDKNKLNNNPIYSVYDLFLSLRFDIASSTVLIKKKALLDMGGFCDDNNYPFVDLPTYLYLAKKGTFIYLNEVLGYYRRVQSSSWISFAKKSKSSGREEMRLCINNFIQHNISKNFLTKRLVQMQDIYLFFRRCTAGISFLFNSLVSK